MTLLGLAGFLGRSSDFDGLWTGLRASGLCFEARALSVSADPEWGPVGGWEEWISASVPRIRSMRSAGPLVGIGYSLGGRLLLSLADREPGLFDGLVFLSVNPGLSSPAEREERAAADERWARRFESDPWDLLMKDWNAQAVFRGGVSEPERAESAFDRARLARVLREFGLARQKDFRPAFLQWQAPRLWAAGARDPKFVSLLEGLRASAAETKRGGISFQILPRASHRLLFDSPEDLTSTVAAWAKSAGLG